jgi:2-haloacid dehalogenase
MAPLWGGGGGRIGAGEAGEREGAMPLDGVKALVFDVFGTVVDWRGSVAREVAPFLKAHAPDADPGAFADAWRALYNPAMAEIRDGRRPFVRLDVLHRENLEKILPKFGIDPAGIPAEDLEDLNRAWHRLDPWPDSVPGLTRLKRGFIIAPCSNGNIIMMVNMAKRSGIPWDAILGAEVAQAYKPAPETYLRTCEVLAMRPDEVCLVAAHNQDLAAARRCGLKTGYVPRANENAPNTPPPPATEAWDLIAEDFNAFAEALGL